MEGHARQRWGSLAWIANTWLSIVWVANFRAFMCEPPRLAQPCSPSDESSDESRPWEHWERCSPARLVVHYYCSYARCGSSFPVSGGVADRPNRPNSRISANPPLDPCQNGLSTSDCQWPASR